MKHSFSRRSALKTIAGSTAALGAALSTAPLGQAAKGKAKLKGNIRHSVCKWCYGSIGLDKLAAKASSLGMNLYVLSTVLQPEPMLVITKLSTILPFHAPPVS